jgi:hypothetical protein
VDKNAIEVQQLSGNLLGHIRRAETSQLPHRVTSASAHAVRRIPNDRGVYETRLQARTNMPMQVRVLT